MAIDLGKKFMLAEKMGEITGLCNEIGKDARMDYMGETEINQGGTSYLFYCYGCEKLHIISKTCEIFRLRFKSRFKDKNSENPWEYLI